MNLFEEAVWGVRRCFHFASDLLAGRKAHCDLGQTAAANRIEGMAKEIVS